jgi:hypothetical protein
MIYQNSTAADDDDDQLKIDPGNLCSLKWDEIHPRWLI